LVVERPVDADVDSELTALALVLIPDDAEVESEETLLLVVDRPVESELIPLDADVDRDPT
jgi:hypothetical protein